MNKEIYISKGNMKLGNIWNISLPPILSCAKKLPCYKTCYARKAYRLYPGTKKAWDKNFNLYKINPDKYFKLLDEFLQDKQPEYFRFHVSGDIPDQEYFNRMIFDIVMKHKNIKFLIFTKKFNIIKTLNNPPPNISIILSMWPNLPIDKGLQKKYPVAWMYDKKNPDPRIPKENIIKCNSNCQTCNKIGKTCWNLFKLGKDVVFHKH
jgi:hypothetical protein